MDLNEITAAEIMSTELTTVDPGRKIIYCRSSNPQEKVGGLPVVRNGNELIGIITQRDIQFAKYAGVGVGKKSSKLLI